MLQRTYKNGNKPIKTYEANVEDRNGISHDYLVGVYEEWHSDSNGAVYDGYQFRACDINSTPGELIMLFITNFPTGFQSTMISSNGTKLRGVGLPESLIYIASDYLKSDIDSSSNMSGQKRYSIEERLPAGDKVWQRLMIMAKHKVIYDQSTDRYTFQF